MKSWKRFWNEEKRKECPCKQKSCRRCLNWKYLSGFLNVKKVRGTEEKKKVKGWSTEEMKDKSREDREKDTEEMVKWRSISQEEMEQCWKRLSEKMEEEVLDTYKVGGQQARCFFFDWRRVREGRKYNIRKWREDCWAKIFALFKEYNLRRLKGMHEDLTEGEEVKRQSRMTIMKDMTKKTRSKGWMLLTDCG